MLQILSDYLLPVNPIASSIVKLLLCFFFIWIAVLIYCWRQLSVEGKHIRKNEDIKKLAVARQKRTHERRKIFNDFLSDKGMSKDSAIAKHLKAIFLAGWDESRLEISELINHTNSNLFRLNSLLRSVLAIFIVVGLLGTLFGLTDSLTDLSSALKESSPAETPTENSEKMTQALGILMDDIKGAFAPSIWGISFTIAGVLLYGFYLQFACHPVKSILEQLTLTVWVPQLYPTTSQTLVQTLQQSESQMQKGFETAARFSESVEKVNESLRQARAITQPLSDSVIQLNKATSDISTAANVLNANFTENLDRFSGEFSSNVRRLSGFQDEIRNLHQQFQDTANQKLDQQIETLNKQNKNLTKTLAVLENSEKLYIDSCQQIDETLQKFLQKTTKTSTDIKTTNKQFLKEINESNREWIKEIQEQLKTDLTIIQPTLEEVQKSLDDGLKGLTGQFKFFQTPIEETANQIEGVIENFTKIMEGTVDNLQSEFQKQQEVIKQQHEKYEEQLTGVKNLNESVKGLLTQLDESSKNQREAVNTLGTNIGGLTTDIQSLDSTIKSFTSDSGNISQSVGAIKGHVETLGNASQELVQKADVTPLNASIGKLNATIEQISRNSQTLADAVNGLTRQINSSGSEPPPKRPLFRFLRRKTDGK